jgi:transcription-repair coupling factor (superfamily II helicase)
VSILEETGKNCEKVVISGINNLFSKIYLTPLLKQSRVFWLCFKNNYELQQAKELFNWQQKNFSANPAELLIWPEKDELNPQQIWQIFISPNLICLTTVNNLESKIIEQKKFQQELITLRLNQPYQPIELKTQLILAGYELNNYVDQPGLVSHRGEILDVWSAQLPQPLRSAFTGNQLTK